MEGLIPMVYRAIKRSKQRSHYECLSSSTARTYDISDFYQQAAGSQTQARSHFYLTPPSTVDKGPFQGRGVRHSRSHSSAEELSFGKRRFNPEDGRGMPVTTRKQQLVRFRSTRMLSCLTGA